MTSTTSLTSAHLCLSPSSPLSNPLRHRHKTLLLLAPNSHPRRRQRRPLLKVSYFSQVPSLRLSSKHSNVREWTLKCSGSGSTESEKVEVGASGVAGGEEKVKEEESQRVFEKLLTAEKERVEKQEEFERQAHVQLERQLVVASEWSRALLQWQGKLKGTEWDPEDSHRIDYIDFVKLLDSKNVKFMEYSDYGQAVSVILPYYKEKTKGIEAKEDSAREIIYKRHVVDRMPVDGWNETWKKLHQQVVNVDMLNANPIPGEVYSTVAVTVVWSMRLALAIVMFLCIDHFTRPIYTKVIRFKKEKVKPLPEKEIEPIELKTDPRLGSMGKSRAKFIAAEERTGVTFDDFGGQDYVKKELQEIVEMLKNEEEYQKMGIYCPKGVLLHGPPGTGKTLLAKAIAGESGLPFFATNGTDFVEMFSGIAASRVKDGSMCPIPHLHVSRLPKLMPPILTPLHPWTRRQCPTGSSPRRQSHSIIRVEKQSIGGFEDDGNQSIAHVKMQLYKAVEGINKGVFGVTAAKKAEIEGLVEALEPLNPTMNPTLHLDKVAGSWKVLYSSIKILGPKRTKLGLRDFITLGDFWQHIDIDMGKAVNVIEFNAMGLNMLKGQLTIDARFSVASTSRVSIKYSSSSITPEQLLKVFKHNYELLISIFNPDGWLEITYLDETLRIGRDDKENIFILERSTNILV